MKLLTLPEVAAMLRRPEATLRYWRHCGDRGPRSFKSGRAVVYDEADVLAWIEAQKAGGGEAA